MHLCIIGMCLDSGKFGQAETQPATNEWSAAMFPLAEQLILLQTNLLFEIARHDFVDNADAASARILDLLSVANPLRSENACE